MGLKEHGILMPTPRPSSLCDKLSSEKRHADWEPKVKFKELVKIMIEADLELAKREAQIAALRKYRQKK